MKFLNIEFLKKTLMADTTRNALSASFLFSSTLLFFGPSVIYFTNLLDFSFKFSDIFPALVALTLGIGTVLTICLVILKGRVHRIAVCFLFALGLLIYIQANILIWNYGSFNGRPINWDSFLVNGIIDISVWLLVLVIFTLKTEKLYKFIAIVSVFLFFVQAGGLIGLIHSSQPEPEWKSHFFVPGDSKFVFSENQNVVIIVLDAFESDVFQEIINEDDNYRKMFTGFTYYRNAVGGYQTTTASVPLILTGKYYTNSEPIDIFIKDAFTTSSLPKTLKNNNYSINIYDDSRLVFPDEQIEENVQSASVDSITALNKLYHIALFRDLPHFLKQATYKTVVIGSNPGMGIPDRSYFDAFANQTQFTKPERVFKFYHLSGSHPPYLLNESLGYEELPYNRTGNIEQSKAFLRITNELLKNANRSGMYDNTMIIIVGDHGQPFRLNTSQLNRTVSISYTSQNIIMSGIPLILVKPFYSNTSLAISDTPVSLSDIPKTVTNELNIPNNFPGQSMKSIQVNEKRERSFFAYNSNSKISDYYGYLPPLKQYIISNFSWFGGSWKPTYWTHSSHGSMQTYPPNYSINSTINFRKNTESEEYLTETWSYNDDDNLISNEKMATIKFSLNKPETDLTLDITLKANIIPEKPSPQRVFVYVNRHEIGNFTLTNDTKYEKHITVPHAYWEETIQHVTFYLPDAVSTPEIETSISPGERSIVLDSITLTPMNVSTPVL